MSNRLIVSACCVVFLAGCNTTGTSQTGGVSYNSTEEVLEAWKGKKVDDLLTVWGAPKDSQKLPRGSTLFTYEQTKVIPGQNNTALVGALLGGGTRGYMIGSAFNNEGQNLNFECIINVRVSQKGIIEQAVISKKNNPVLEDLCAKLARPPLKA